MNAKRNRPATGSGGSQVIAATTTSMAPSTDIRPNLTAAEVYQIIRGRLAAHVIVKDAAGRVTCRSFANLRAADRAVERAQHRGCAATVVMVRQDVAPLVAAGGAL